MVDELKILTECHADTITVGNILSYKLRQRHLLPQHKDNNASVIATMNKQFKNGLVLGIIDDDKTKPAGFDQFEVHRSEEGIVWLKKPDSRHNLIVISPAIEGFLLTNAETAGVNPEDYGFRNLNALKRVTKNANASRDSNLKDFINTLVQKNPASFSTLWGWVEEIFK